LQTMLDLCLLSKIGIGAAALGSHCRHCQTSVEKLHLSTPAALASDIAAARNLPSLGMASSPSRETRLSLHKATPQRLGWAALERLAPGQHHSSCRPRPTKNSSRRARPHMPCLASCSPVSCLLASSPLRKRGFYGEEDHCWSVRGRRPAI